MAALLYVCGGHSVSGDHRCVIDDLRLVGIGEGEDE